MITPEDTVLLLLASGKSTRFEDGDKLLANFKGKRLLDHVSANWRDFGAAFHVAVVGEDQSERRSILDEGGWITVVNESPDRGMGHSVALGIGAVQALSCQAAIVALADMPLVGKAHAESLCKAYDPSYDAITTSTASYRGPPTLFTRRLFAEMAQLDGDDGARAILNSSNTRAIPLTKGMSIDIDTQSDLKIASDLEQ